MKDVVSAMFSSFNKYNEKEDIVGDDEGESTEPEAETPEEVPAEETPEEEPTDEEPVDEEPTDDEGEASSEDLFADSFVSNKRILEDINYWLE